MVEQLIKHKHLPQANCHSIKIYILAIIKRFNDVCS